MHFDSISIVVPFYNEAFILGKTIEELVRFKASSSLPITFILSDDGSTDASSIIAQKAALAYPETFRYVSAPKNTGKGNALQIGFAIAEGELLGFLDSDLEISTDDLGKGIRRMNEGNDQVLIGTKTMVVSNSIRAYHRGMASIFYNALVGFTLNSHLPDHQCGLKLFRREVWERVGSRMTSHGWAWDTEFLLRAQKAGFPVTPFEVTLHRQRKSTVRFWSTCFSMFGAVLRFMKEGLSL